MPPQALLRRLWKLLREPARFEAALLYRAALLAPRLAPPRRWCAPAAGMERAGISVVIPSRNGRELLAAQLPGIVREMACCAMEVIVVDNGSDDGTARWLAREYPQAAVEHSPAPLSFARAVNRGIRRARYSHVCLLNNDMLLEPGFFAPLRAAFEAVPDLFAATAQIFFPPGVRREETGKTVMAQSSPADFPVRCDEPLAGEDLTWVLYGSGGCSLYDAAKLRALGGVNEAFEPAYVEDLDLGYRGWQRGWPTVYVARARLEHRHRTTTSRYYDAAALDRILELNYLRFLASAVSSPVVFRRLWRQALDWLRLNGSIAALRHAWRIPLDAGSVPEAVYPEELFLALAGGGVAVFPGCAPGGRPVAVVGSDTLPDAGWTPPVGFAPVLVAFCESLEPPPPQLLELCAEVVLVRRGGEEDAAFRAALDQTVRKWRPAAVRFAGNRMEQYARGPGPA